MAEEENYQYTLRAGSPMPIGDNQFVLHTFMAEKNVIDFIPWTQTLPESTEFRGQGGTYMSASFSRLPDIGGKSFQGKIIGPIIYIEEDDI